MGKTIIPGGGPNDRAVLQGMYLFPGVVGDARYVLTGGSSTGPGWAPENAYATLIQAQSASTASQGDVVLVLPGHTESIVAAAGMTFSKAGVTYVGLGVGSNRPTITFSTSTAAQMIVSGANVTFRNFIFDFTGIDAIVAAISVTAANVSFEDCEFITNNASAGVVLGILTAATATKFAVKRCKFIGHETNAGTTTTAQIKHEVGDDAEISDCFFTGKMTGAILNVTASVLRLRLLRNYIHTYTGTVAWTLSTTCTGIASENRIVVASGTTPVVGAALSYTGNRYTTEGNGPTGGTADAI